MKPGENAPALQRSRMIGKPNKTETKAERGTGGYNWPRTLVSLLILFVVFTSSLACAMELRIPRVKGKSGRDIRVPLVIDQTTNLAGVRLVLHYDKEILTYKNYGMSKETQSFMNVVNDRTPGTLIVVMASARGIQGKEITLLSLYFTVKKGLKGKQSTAIEMPSGQQFMSDEPKDVECAVKSGTVEISP
jgi:hypothetical protein